MKNDFMDPLLRTLNIQFSTTGHPCQEKNDSFLLFIPKHLLMRHSLDVRRWKSCQEESIEDEMKKVLEANNNN